VRARRHELELLWKQDRGLDAPGSRRSGGEGAVRRVEAPR